MISLSPSLSKNYSQADKVRKPLSLWWASSYRGLYRKWRIFKWRKTEGGTSLQREASATFCLRCFAPLWKMRYFLSKYLNVARKRWRSQGNIVRSHQQDLTWGGGGEEDTQPGLIIDALTTRICFALRQAPDQVKHPGLKQKILSVHKMW